MNAEAQQTIAEGKKLLAACKGEPRATGPYGSDLSVAVRALIEWIKVQLASQGNPNIKKAILHFLHETALPKLKDYTPMLGDVTIDLLIMAVKGWCDSIPDPAPV
jgi:hypothetical protein